MDQQCKVMDQQCKVMAFGLLVVAVETSIAYKNSPLAQVYACSRAQAVGSRSWATCVQTGNRKQVAGSGDWAASRGQGTRASSGKGATVTGSGELAAAGSGRRAASGGQWATERTESKAAGIRVRRRTGKRAVGLGRHGQRTACGRQWVTGSSRRQAANRGMGHGQHATGRKADGGRGKRAADDRWRLGTTVDRWRARWGSRTGTSLEANCNGCRHGGYMEGENKSRLIPIKKRVLLLTAERTLMPL
ncbi:hypothetical protein GGX14DRAFT_398884 [Mycena pura]|uniref:Uncharacterized protein n=1 Tax=Mycena pura TaxID=153505 RepID=A0AAD6V9C0_9AGAR|nr:hypothetical protein GGX14DRAFT_398884 [Mycena pura]